MKASERGIALIREFEGLRLRAYRDGGGVWTIGYGHTLSVRPGMKISKARAEWLLSEDVARTEVQVQIATKAIKLTQNQFDALVSFTFNLGGHRLRSSTLLVKLHAGDYAGAADEFPRWNKDNGEVVAGLVRRRAAERALFLEKKKPASDSEAGLGS